VRFEQSFDEGDGRRSAVHAAALMRAALIVACEVLVENAMPLALRKTESVLWIFNTARLLSSVQDAEAPGDLPLNFHPAAVRASANVTPFGALSVAA